MRTAMVLNACAHAAGIEVGAFFIASDPQVNENMGEYTGEFSYRIYFYRIYDDLVVYYFHSHRESSTLTNELPCVHMKVTDNSSNIQGAEEVVVI